MGNALVADDAFLNACHNSDRENAYLEGAAAIRRIVMESGDLQLTKLYFDMPAFHNRLHQELLDELYPTLATTVTPSPYKVTQAGHSTRPCSSGTAGLKASTQLSAI